MNKLIIPANGLGDAILWIPVARALKGCVIAHRYAKELSPLFPDLCLIERPDLPEALFSHYESVIIQNDHGKFCHRIAKSRPPHVRFCCDRVTPLAREGDLFLCQGMPIGAAMLHAFSVTQEPSLFKITLSQKKKDSKCVAIHPYSGAKERNFPERKFAALATKLQALGYRPIFIMSEQERAQSPFSGPKLSTLQEMAEALSEASFFIGNDSGPGHLASFLAIPTLTISPNRKRSERWRPSFCPGALVTPPFPLINFRHPPIKIRDKYWSLFVPVARVMAEFKKCARLVSMNSDKNT